MAWLHSSFMRYQAHEGAGSNIRKGYKVASIDKDNDPDKSDTPLLQEMSSTADEKYTNFDWSKNISLPSKCHAFIKPNLSAGEDKCSSSVKLKNKETSTLNNAGKNEKQKEDKELLNLKEKSVKYEEEDDDDDSEDEWGFSSSGGYQK